MHEVKLKLLLLAVGYIAWLHDKAYVCLCVRRGTICTCVGLGTCVCVKIYM